MKRGQISLSTDRYLPARSVDLIYNKNKIYAVVYTLAEAAEDKLALGVTKAKDGIYDIVLDVPEVNVSVIEKALKELSKITTLEYRLR